MITSKQVKDFSRILNAGGVAIFPSDTVYGLGCSAVDAKAVRRIDELKGRNEGKPTAVMFFDLELALGTINNLGSATEKVVRSLLPGPITVLVNNPGLRFKLAARRQPILGIRVPLLKPEISELRKVELPIIQSSANLAGGKDPSILNEIPESIIGAVDYILDGGLLQTEPSTVLDLSCLEIDGTWNILRPGAVSKDAVSEVINSEVRYRSAN